MKIPDLSSVTLCFVLFVSLLVPVSSADELTESERYSVPYLTLRNVTGDVDPDEWYGEARDSVHAGHCAFSQKSLSLLEPLSRNGLVHIPQNWNLLETITETVVSALWDDVEKSAKGQRPLLYIHGYNTSFAKACDQAALFQANLGLEGRLILFSWPSDGSLINYPGDESDLFWSVAPLEATLEHMVEKFGAGGFDVVAHSLGARGVFLALVQLAHRHHESKPLLNQLVLTAPDIDAGIFQQYVADIRSLVGNISLYVSENDKPLALSEEVHGYPRLGQAGSHLEGLEGIQVIDVTGVGVRSFSGHLYHLYHDSVEQDLNLLLNQGLDANQREKLIRQADNRWRL